MLLVEPLRSHSSSTRRLASALGAAFLLILAAGPAPAADLEYLWDGNTHSGTNWSVTANWSPSPADEIASDGNNAVLRTVGFSAQRTLVLDTNRTVGKIWYNTDGTIGTTSGPAGSSSAGGLTISSTGGSILTLATETGTPQIAAGRITTTTSSVTINAVLAGTQGFTVTQQSAMYRGLGLILTAANTISGTVSLYQSLTLTNVQALEFATLALASGGTLFLHNDTNNAEFLTNNLIQTTSSNNTTINVDRATAGGAANQTLILEGSYSVNAGTSGTKTLNIAGGNGYSLAMTGAVTNNNVSTALQISPNSANVKFSNTVAIGAGLILSGALTTGVNEISGVVSGTGTVAKSDVSYWKLNAANNYTGATSVTAGTLEIGSTGSINTTSGISVTGGTFKYGGATALNRAVTVNGGAFIYNSASAYTGALTLTSGTIGGNGNLTNNSISIGAGLTLSPGNSPGTINTGTETWAGGGSYLWEVNKSNGTKGVDSGWDWTNISGDLNITATSGNKFTLKITGLDLTNAGGLVDSFDNTQNYIWTIATASGTISGFDASLFSLDTTNFENNNALGGGSFDIVQSGNNLNLRFLAVPEPSAALMLLSGSIVLLTSRRKRKG